MRERMRVGRIFAAANMAAGEAYAQLRPSGAERHAFLAAAGARRHRGVSRRNVRSVRSLRAAVKRGRRRAARSRVYRARMACVVLASLARQREALAQCLLARRREMDHARAARAAHPSEVDPATEKCCAHGTRQMMAAHAPVKAGVRQATALRGKIFDVDPGVIEKVFASSREN